MEVNIRRKNGYKILDVDGDINEVDNYNEIKEVIICSLEKGENKIALNLSNTTFLNSGAVGFFISMQKKISGEGGNFVIVEPAQVILEILRILSIERVIKIYLTEDEFIQDISSN